jgi:hypothetical protein
VARAKNKGFKKTDSGLENFERHEKSVDASTGIS